MHQLNSKTKFCYDKNWKGTKLKLDKVALTLTLCLMSHNEIYETLKSYKNIFQFLRHKKHFSNHTCLDSENECINRTAKRNGRTEAEANNIFDQETEIASEFVEVIAKVAAPPEHEQAFVALDDPMEVVDEANFVFEAPEVELLEEIITVDVLPKAMGETSI